MLLRRSTVLLALALLSPAFGISAQSPVSPPASSSTSLPNDPPVPVSAETRAAAARLLGDILVNGQAYEYDRELADTIGPRLTGSANYNRAAAWAEDKLRSLGLHNVHTETWTIPATWEPDPDHPATGHILSPVDHTLHIYSVGWSPSTPAGGVSGPVIYLPSFAPDVLDATLPRARGSMILFDREAFNDSVPFTQVLSALARIRSSGVVALLLPGGKNGTESLTSLNFSGAIDPIPEAQIGAEDASLIHRLLDHGSPVTLQFTLTNRIRHNVQVPNVLADLPGSEPSLPVVMIGAHLDSWNPGTGAQDNGTGVATVLEAARALKALDHRPLRTVRFALFGGEEEGLLGSTAFAIQHRGQLTGTDCILISDTGAQPARGWYLMGRDDEASALKDIEPLLAGVGADQTSTSTEFLFETDHAALDVLGVPSLVLWNDTDLYFGLHHKASDTFDSVVQRDLNQGVAVTAVTAFALASSNQPFAPHLTPAEAEAMLARHNQLDEYKGLQKIGALP